MCTMCQGMPPGQVKSLQIVTTPTATILDFTWEVSGYIDQLNVTYNYTVKECLKTSAGGPFDVIISNGSVRSHTLRDLNEDSNYTITVKAINTAGSTVATISFDTMASGKTIQ